MALQWGIVFSEKDFESTGYPYENRTLDPYPTQMSILEAMYNYMQSTSREMLGLKKHKLESRLLGEISITSDMQMTPPPLWQEVKKN